MYWLAPMHGCLRELICLTRFIQKTSYSPLVCILVYHFKTISWCFREGAQKYRYVACKSCACVFWFDYLLQRHSGNTPLWIFISDVVIYLAPHISRATSKCVIWDDSTDCLSCSSREEYTLSIEPSYLYNLPIHTQTRTRAHTHTHTHIHTRHTHAHARVHTHINGTHRCI